MREKRQRTVVLGLVAAAAIPLMIAATAFACANLAVIKLDRANAKPGDRVTALGRNFSTAKQASDVTVRFNGRNGPVLWQGRPDAKGRIRPAFTAPRARGGNYVILATQQTAAGAPVGGTPGRAPLRIRGSKSSSSVIAAPLASPSGGPSLPAGVPVFGAVLALLLAMSGGAVALASAARRRQAGYSPAGSAS